MQIGLPRAGGLPPTPCSAHHLKTTISLGYLHFEGHRVVPDDPVRALEGPRTADEVVDVVVFIAGRLGEMPGGEVHFVVLGRRRLRVGPGRPSRLLRLGFRFAIDVGREVHGAAVQRVAW